MIEVEGPGGVIVEFPDGTPRDVMTQAMRKQFGGQQQAQMGRGEAAIQGAGQGLTLGLADEMGAASQANLEAGQATIPSWRDAQSRVAQIAKQGPRAYAEGRGAQDMQTYRDAQAQSYDANLASSRDRLGQAREQFPFTTAAGEIGGAVASGIGAAPVSLSRAGGSLLSRMGRGALDAGMWSFAYGVGAGEGGAESRIREGAESAVIGAPLGALAPAVGDVAKRALQSKAVRKFLPTLEQIQTAKNNAYQRVEGLGVRYSPKAFDSFIDSVEASLRKGSISAQRHPNAYSMLDDIQKLKGQNPSITELDELRQVIYRDVASIPDGKEAEFGREMIRQLDSFIDNAPATSATSGNPAEAASAIREARQMNKRWRRAQEVAERAYQAENNAAATGSGANADNAMRQRLKSILNNKKQRSQFSPEEITAMEKAVRGGPVQNAMRLIGKLAPTGIVSAGGSGGIGYMVGGPVGAAAAPAVGFAAKAVADGMSAKNLKALESLVFTGGQGIDDQLLRSLLPAGTLQRLSGTPASQQALRRLGTLGGPIEQNLDLIESRQ